MPFHSISSNKPRRPVTARTVLTSVGLVLIVVPTALAFDILPDTAAGPVAVDPLATEARLVEPSSYELYLAVSINGIPRNGVAVVRREIDGSLTMSAEDLSDAGIAPAPEATLPDGRIALDRLPDVTYVLDEALQTIDFTAPDAARARLIIAAGGVAASKASPAPSGQSRDFGAVLNYDIYASATRPDGAGIVVAPLAGNFEARAFGPFGLVEQSFSVLGGSLDFRRLNSTWSYADPDSMRTYRAGDIVTGALSWTRPTRLGGLQVQNDFGLRSDIVTYPMPTLSGSAALPSSVEVYVNNSNRYSADVPAGPFDIVDVPVITGAGTVELVVRDANGNQVVTKTDYFASPKLLKPGLWDYSAELGFARTNFATRQDGYDRRLMGSASLRTGVTDWLTWEGHAEGGASLINAGAGAVFALGRLGTGQFSAAGSATPGDVGLQLTGSLQLGFGDVSFGARAQRSFGHYEDIASVTRPGGSGKPSGPAALYQVSMAVPTPFASGRFNLSYTQSEPASGDVAQIIAASYGQRLLAGSASATTYVDMRSRHYGVTASVWMPLGGDISTGTSVHTEAGHSSISADIGHGGGNELGDIGWLVRVNQDDATSFFASARTTLPAANVRTRLAHRNGETGVSAQLSGAVVAADGGVFLSGPIEDAFAIADVGTGAAGVPVLYQNRVVGITGKDGKVLLPGLVAYQKNRISIDPSTLPLDRMVDDTTETVVPARRAGVVVTFGKRITGGTALVSFRDSTGAYLPVGSSGLTSSDAPEFVVGYDGQALLEGLGPQNHLSLLLPDGSTCGADVNFVSREGELANIPDVVCQPQ